MDRTAPEIKVFSAKVRPDPDAHEVEIFGLEISQGDGVWSESFATKAEVDAFLRGIQAGSSMTGGPYVSIPFEFEIERRGSF